MADILDPAAVVGAAMDKHDEPPRPLYRDPPPAAPFPADALGSRLTPAARAVHEATQAPMAMCGQSLLAAGSLVAQGLADLRLPHGAVVPLSLFAVTVAASGERKSAVDRLALKPVREKEALLRDECAGDLQSYANSFASWEAVRKDLLNRHKKDRAKLQDALDELGPAPKPPMAPVLTLSEPNYTGLVRAFDEGRPALGLFSAEGGAFVGGWGMSDEQRLRTAAGLSDLWDGAPIQRARGGEGVRVLPGRRLALHLMVQPGVAQRFVTHAELVDQGLASRLLVTAPDSAAGTRLWREPGADAETDVRRYTGFMLDLLRRPLPVSRNDDRALDPPALALSRAARDLWVETHDAIERQMAPGGDLEPIRGFAAKGAEHAARIAGVLAVLDDPDTREVSGEHMAHGAALVEHYLAEALRLQAVGAVNGELRLAQRLLDWLRQRWREPAVALTEIYQRGPSAIRDRAKAKRAVDVLVEHGWLVEAGEGEVAGEKRRQTWRLRTGARP